MRNLSLLISFVVTMLGLSLYAYAQNSPAGQPVAAVVTAAGQIVSAAPVASPISSTPSAGFIAIVVAIVAGLNALLSSIQKIFAGLSKSEPGWLQTLSNIILEVAKFLGSNPSV